MVAKPPGRLHPSRLEIDPSKKWPGRNVTVMPAAAPIALSIQIAVHTSPTVEARVGFVRSDAASRGLPTVTAAQTRDQTNNALGCCLQPIKGDGRDIIWGTLLSVLRIAQRIAAAE